jgi:hypothetical protein
LTVQVPAATRLIVEPFVPLDVHTAVGVEVNNTGRPDDAVAETVNGVWSIVRFGRLPNVIV